MSAPATAETPAFLATLHSSRRHVLGILEGLGDDDLRRPVLPSGWSCLGLVRHLALDVERFWFRAVAAGEAVELESGNDAWRVPPGMPADEVFALYRDEVAQAESVLAERPLDAAPAWWPPDLFGEPAPPDLRSCALHVLTETACHAGHLDAVRELIDGRTWLVMPE